MTDLNDFNDRMFFQSYDIGRYSYFIEKIGKSTSDLISDRQQQVVSFTLLADTMELRSSFLFVSKNKYDPMSIS